MATHERMVPGIAAVARETTAPRPLAEGIVRPVITMDASSLCSVDAIQTQTIPVALDLFSRLVDMESTEMSIAVLAGTDDFLPGPAYQAGAVDHGLDGFSVLSGEGPDVGAGDAVEVGS